MRAKAAAACTARTRRRRSSSCAAGSGRVSRCARLRARSGGGARRHPQGFELATTQKEAAPPLAPCGSRGAAASPQRSARRATRPLRSASACEATAASRCAASLPLLCLDPRSAAEASPAPTRPHQLQPAPSRNPHARWERTWLGSCTARRTSQRPNAPCTSPSGHSSRGGTLASPWWTNAAQERPAVQFRRYVPRHHVGRARKALRGPQPWPGRVLGLVRPAEVRPRGRTSLNVAPSARRGYTRAPFVPRAPRAALYRASQRVRRGCAAPL